MTAQGWAQAVRDQVELGRLLPLGGPDDGAWIAERAAAAVLRRAAAEVAGVRVTSLRIALDDPDGAWAAAESAASAESAGFAGFAGSDETAGPADAATATPRAAAGRRVPPPASALPPGPLRIDAECDAGLDRPMTDAAESLRTALWRCAEDRVGLALVAVDVHVTGLLDDAPEDAGPGPAADDAPYPPAQKAEDAGLGVPGVLAAHVAEDGGHAEVRIAVAAGHRALDVALAVRAAVAAATVAVLVTAVRDV